MAGVIGAFRQLWETYEPSSEDNKAVVGMQMWFETPAFLVDLFRRLNPRLELVPSDPVMDALRMVKDPEEMALMTKAQRIATVGVDRVRAVLHQGITAQEVAAEAMCAMMRAGAEGTSTPVYVNFGPYTCMIHGGLSPRPLEIGDLIVVNLNPQVGGYCANLSRTFVLGEPDTAQSKLMAVYQEMVAETRKTLRPGVTVKDLDAVGKQICQARGLGEHHLEGISHGIGLRFEETPASTIIKQHRNVSIRENMTLTIGHTVLALPGVGGVRNEDVYRVTSDGCEILIEYQTDWIVPCEA
jgi:Xaa-Pro aminopeptidase